MYVLARTASFDARYSIFRSYFMFKIIKRYTQNRLSFHHSYQRTQTSERLPSLRYFSLSAIDLRSVKDWDAIKPDHIGKSNTGLKHTGPSVAVHKEGCNVWHCTPSCGWKKLLKVFHNKLISWTFFIWTLTYRSKTINQFICFSK